MEWLDRGLWNTPIKIFQMQSCKESEKFVDMSKDNLMKPKVI
jgi:hypothetical protein